MKKLLPLFWIISILFVSLTAAAEPTLIYGDSGRCCYLWMVVESSNGAVLGSGKYCIPSCVEGTTVRSSQNITATLEQALVLEAWQKLPQLNSQKLPIQRGTVAGPTVRTEGPIGLAAIGKATRPAIRQPIKGCRLTECSVAPNPVQEYLTVKLSYDCTGSTTGPVKAGTITARSLTTGRDTLLWAGNFQQEVNELRLSCAALAAGFYEVKVQAGQFAQTFRVEKR
jgi:hypothetical protein